MSTNFCFRKILLAGTVAKIFQLKWQEMYGASMKERYSRINNLYPKVVEWIDKVESWINESDVSHHMESPEDLYITMCPTLYNKLIAEMEAKVIYKPSQYQRQGVVKCELDGHQIVSVPYLQKDSETRAWVTILNMRYWELRMSGMRNFSMTPFKWQGENANSYDYWLARIMMAGNFMCWKPNANMWLTSVS